MSVTERTVDSPALNVGPLLESLQHTTANLLYEASAAKVTGEYPLGRLAAFVEIANRLPDQTLLKALGALAEGASGTRHILLPERPGIPPEDMGHRFVPAEIIPPVMVPEGSRGLYPVLITTDTMLEAGGQQYNFPLSARTGANVALFFVNALLLYRNQPELTLTDLRDRCRFRELGYSKGMSVVSNRFVRPYRQAPFILTRGNGTIGIDPAAVFIDYRMVT